MAFAAGWGWSGLFTFAVVKDNPHAPAAATGITQVGKLVGAALGPAVFGWLADSLSYGTAWWTITGTLMVAAVLLLYVRGRRTAAPAANCSWSEHRALAIHPRGSMRLWFERG